MRLISGCLMPRSTEKLLEVLRREVPYVLALDVDLRPALQPRAEPEVGEEVADAFSHD
jgi:hypothetical protein